MENMISKLKWGWAMCLVASVTISPAMAKEGGKVHGEGLRHGRRGIEARVQNQERRIKRGLEKGRLTEAEAKDLQAGVDAIKAEAKAAADSDGKVTKEERQNLRKRLKESSQAIRNAKHPAGEKPSEGGAAPAEAGSAE